MSDHGTKGNRGLRNAQLWLRADFIRKIALGYALIGGACLAAIMRSLTVTGSAVADAAVAFAVAATLGCLARRVLAMREQDVD